MRVEAAAANGDTNSFNITPQIEHKNGVYILKTSNILYNMLKSRYEEKICDITAFGQKYLALGMAEIALEAAVENDIKNVALSGGVFVNSFITTKIIDTLSKEGLKVLFHRFVTPGDGGIAIGQSLIALFNVI